MMPLIATHNSATGEGAYDFKSWILTPFAKCQSKSILQQIQNGCNYFDVRIRYVDGVLRCCHGLYVIDATLRSVIAVLNTRPCYVRVTYEGWCPNEGWFVKEVLEVLHEHQNVTLVDIREKATWKTLWDSKLQIPCNEEYHALKWFTWKLLLPIPWLWAKLWKEHDFSDKHYTMIDFL